jgi:DNA invertase Pin-like site-specific DNA recombinase
MIVRNVPLISFIAAPRVLGSKEATTIVTRGGKYKGRKPSLTVERVLELQRRAGAGEKKTALAREFGVSRETVYTHLAGADKIASV